MGVRPMPTSPLPSLKLVAKLANVSLSTASRALHGSARLLPSTIAAVQEAARKVGYHTNPYIADTMRRVRTRQRSGHLGAIAYLTFHDGAAGWKTNSTYLRFHEGAEQRARELGFALDTIWACEPRMHAARLTTILKTRGIGGVVIGPRPTQPRPDLLEWGQFASASVGVPLPGVQLHQAGSHHARLLERALAVLSTRDYRRPGLVLLESQLSKTDPGWAATWHHWQARCAARCRVPMLVLPKFDEELVRRWMKRYRPDAVIGVEEKLAGVVQRSGARVPEEIAFVHLSRPERADAPAGMDQRPRAIGAAAIDLVANQIFSGEKGVATLPRILLVEGLWTEGWSVRLARE
jgi:LacI family transcriptional regulator